MRGRENVQVKGRRLLGEGRLTITKVTPDGLIVATCKGDSGEVYNLGYDPRTGQRQWRCTCVARGRCSHLVALQLVTVKPKTEEG